ncbi:DNA-directed RNA polymerase subunit omega [Clostridioides mangenotii]|uniref:DNA-directed RNA polymerase subunit omega n=1 Tax=Metaclostridioides mangenotii TaxID=1540 RepID=UPI001C1139E6|nr:DNA-directed RNA polymerase subunit omega [Clostridioides mangenotii]MBU5306686.1 DNA-directed RNA polymerase subunit omega [Clostridioides mangenotii]MCR1953558.1 DNA-directed RNA polymerase subunit omega [Clostridioides mangenotii]
MLKPSINEVLERIDNRYFLVGTVAKRSRNLIDGAEPLVPTKDREKPVSVATREVADGLMTYRLLTEEEIEIEEARHYEEQHQHLREEE